MTDPTLKSDFAITIDFDKKSEHPSRVFEAMSAIIKAFEELDRDLVGSIDVKIEPVLLLEDIEIGSLKTWLTQVIKAIPDDAIKDLDAKKILGHYLVKAKYIILSKLEGKVEITDQAFIEDIQYELVEEARNTDVKSFPDYTPISPQNIVKNIDNISKALTPLRSTDQASISTPQGVAKFNIELKLDARTMEDLITAETYDSESTMLLKVKKPDYLGQSKWDFKHGSKLISATISDITWLKAFQDREHDIRPGDSIRARVKTTLKYGYDQSLVATTYDICKVMDIIRYIPGQQTSLHEDVD